MVDFSKMNGYEFEEFITELLNKMDFKAEQTALSGDGGIDIVAYSNRPFFKGKYIIQCKNWNNVVGAPEIRDLYGVVMSERANKGIIITTSDFTQQALDFSYDKNLELINGKQLYAIINDAIDDSVEHRVESANFKSNPAFDISNYNILLQLEGKEAKDKAIFVRKYEFLWNYVLSNEYDIIASGLIDELENHIHRTSNVFGKKGEDLYFYQEQYLNILKGNFSDAFSNILKKVQLNSYLFFQNKPYPDKNDVVPNVGMMLWNLYKIFYYFRESQLCESTIRTICKSRLAYGYNMKELYDNFNQGTEQQKYLYPPTKLWDMVKSENKIVYYCDEQHKHSIDDVVNKLWRNVNFEEEFKKVQDYINVFQ